MSYRHQRCVSTKLSISNMPTCFTETEPFSPLDEHDELITALLTGQWWAIMEVEDHLRSLCEKNECGLTSGHWRIVEAPQRAPVLASSCFAGPLREHPCQTDPHREHLYLPSPHSWENWEFLKKMRRHVIMTPLSLKPPKGPSTLASTPKGAPVPTTSPKEAPVSNSSQEDAPMPTATPEEAPVPAVSPVESPVPARSLEGHPSVLGRDHVHGALELL